MSASRTTDLRVRLKDMLPAPWRLKRSVEHARRAGERELRFLPLLCKPDAASLDVGANRGVYSYAMREHSKEVIALEPNASYARFLRRALGGMRIVEAAASDHEGVATIRVPYREAVAGMGTIEEGNTIKEPFHEAQVRVLTLDSLDLPVVGCMKVDVEGHELAALRGAAGLLGRDHPNLLVEAEDRHRPGAVGSLVEFLTPYGYQGLFYGNGMLQPIDQFDPAVHQRLDTGQHRHEGEYVNNFLFIPAGDSVLFDRLRQMAGAADAAAG